MVFSVVLAILLHTLHVAAGLDGKAANEAVRWEMNNKTVRRGGPLDLRLGVAAKASRLLEWERWYAPGIRTVYQMEMLDSDAPRSYSSDSAIIKSPDAARSAQTAGKETTAYKERFHKALVDMFASTGGTFSPETGMRDSFCYPIRERALKECKPRFMALLMAMGLGIKLDGYENLRRKRKECKIHLRHVQKMDVQDGEEPMGHPIVTECSIEAKDLTTLCDVVAFFNAGVECNCSDPRSENFLLSKETLLQVFILFLFDDTDQVRKFYEHVYRIVEYDKEIFDRCFIEKGTENEDAPNGIKLVRSLVTNDGTIKTIKAIPFTSLNSVPSQGTVNPYARGELTESKPFSDCVEITLLSFLCCLFYVPQTDSYDLSGCGEEARRGRLTEFFRTQNNKPFTVTREVREHWVRVVGDIPSARELGIVYCSNESAGGLCNELCAGFVNFMRVLVSITGLDASEYLPHFNTNGRRPDSDTESKRDADARICEKRFCQLVGRLSGKQVSVDFGEGLVTYTYKVSLLHWDFIGTAKVAIAQERGEPAVFQLVHSEKHNYIKDVCCPEVIDEAVKQQLIRDASALLGSSSNEQDYLMAASVLNHFQVYPKYDAGFGDKLKENAKAGDHRVLFIQFPLRNDEEKIAALEAILPHTMRSEIPQFTRNVLNSLALNEKRVFCAVHPTIAFSTALRNEYSRLLAWHGIRQQSDLGDFAVGKWREDYPLRMCCLERFHNVPEFFVYFNECTVARDLIVSGSPRLGSDIEGYFGMDTVNTIHACGFILASTNPDLGLQTHFFGQLRMDKRTLERAREACQCSGAHEVVQHTLDFFNALVNFTVQARSKDAAGRKKAFRHVCGWCFVSWNVDGYVPFYMELVTKAHAFVEDEFLSYCVGAMKEDQDLDDKNYRDECASFFRKFAWWALAKRVKIDDDAYGVVARYLKKVDEIYFGPGHPRFRPKRLKPNEPKRPTDITRLIGRLDTDCRAPALSSRRGLESIEEDLAKPLSADEKCFEVLKSFLAWRRTQPWQGARRTSLGPGGGNSQDNNRGDTGSTRTSASCEA